MRRLEMAKHRLNRKKKKPNNEFGEPNKIEKP